MFWYFVYFICVYFDSTIKMQKSLKFKTTTLFFIKQFAHKRTDQDDIKIC